jgi:hypothetical protein
MRWSWRAAAAAMAFTAGAAFAQANLGSLAVCSKCASPTVFAVSGLGTANALAQARYTRQEFQAWCDNWTPDDRSCLRAQLAEHDLTKVYKASADCTRGRITPIDGGTYSYAGVWSNDDIGGGRSRWRDPQGQIVGRDNASGGLGIAQQWELLCPKGLAAAAAAAAPRAAPAPAAVPGAAFAVGQAIEARFGRDWVRGRVTRIRPGAGGALDYDVSLENGQRGIVPARMLRAAP